MASVTTVVMGQIFDTVIAAFMTHPGILHPDSKKKKKECPGERRMPPKQVELDNTPALPHLIPPDHGHYPEAAR